MTDTPLDLDAIEARANAATDGPWTWMADDVHGPHGRPVAEVFGSSIAADGAFIAHARTDIPALVTAYRDAADEVERLRGEVAKHPGELDRITYLRAGVITAERDSFTAWVCACGHPRTTHTPLDFGDCTECPHGTCGKHPGLRWDIWHRDTLRERDASRTAHAALVAGLRALHRPTAAVDGERYYDACVTCFDDHERPAEWPCATAAVLDRHGPTTGATP